MMDVGQAITEGIRSTYDDDMFLVGHPWRGFIAWSPEQMRQGRDRLRWGRRTRPLILQALKRADDEAVPHTA